VAPPGFPRSIYLIDLLLCTYATGGVRLLARVVRELAMRSRPGRSRRRIEIYGAGTAGVMLLGELRNNPRLAYDVRGFVDDNELKIGMRVQLVPVLGAGTDLPEIATMHGIEEVLIRRALEKTKGNRTRAAEILEISHRALLYKIKEYGIS
jgi:UDP-GlcNAc:undecaprenyl-phosphate GlcNAc-1-phosphate transferase